MSQDHVASLCLCAGVLLSCGEGARAGVDPFLNGDAGGRLERSDITFAENQTGVVPIAPVSSSGVFEIMNTHLYAAGVNAADLPAGGLGGASAALGASNLPEDGFSYTMISTGTAAYFDQLSVISSSLPDGTAVTVQFAYHVAWAGSATSSLPGGGNTVFARSAMDVSSNVSSSPFGGGSLDSFFLSSGDNRAFFDTGTGTTIVNGLFAGSQQITMTLNAEVGGTINFSVDLDTDVISEVAPAFSMNQTGDASASVGLAFGASPVSSGAGEGAPDVQLISTLRGEEFSPASAANASNAETARPSPPAPPCQGDLDGSGGVDGADLGLLLLAWSPADGSAAGSPADLNGDGKVDGADLGVLLLVWGPCP